MLDQLIDLGVQVVLHTSYRHTIRHTTARMLIDLPPEIINLITDLLSPIPPKSPDRVLQSRPHFSPNQEYDQDRRRIAIYDASGTAGGYETDVVRFAMADPYIARCIAKCGRRVEVDAVIIDRLGVVPCVAEEVRWMVKYVIVTLCAKGKNRRCLSVDFHL
jgi:hypothetical protein